MICGKLHQQELFGLNRDNILFWVLNKESELFGSKIDLLHVPYVGLNG